MPEHVVVVLAKLTKQDTVIGKKYKATHIHRPKVLANNKALGDHVYEHGYFEI